MGVGREVLKSPCTSRSLFLTMRPHITLGKLWGIGKGGEEAGAWQGFRNQQSRYRTLPAGGYEMWAKDQRYADRGKPPESHTPVQASP